jgi:hypothetical protein
MESTRRHTEEPEDRSQREVLAGPIHGAQDPPLGTSVRQPLSCEAKPGGSKQGQREAEQRRELLDASPQLQHLLSELRLREVHNVQTDHDGRRRAQPATRRRARDPEIRGNGRVPGALDETSKAVVVALLRAGRGRHGSDHRPIPHVAQLFEDDRSARADMTTTREVKCGMSVRTALQRIIEVAGDDQIFSRRLKERKKNQKRKNGEARGICRN